MHRYIHTNRQREKDMCIPSIERREAMIKLIEISIFSKFEIVNNDLILLLEKKNNTHTYVQWTTSS